MLIFFILLLAETIKHHLLQPLRLLPSLVHQVLVHALLLQLLTQQALQVGARLPQLARLLLQLGGPCLQRRLLVAGRHQVGVSRLQHQFWKMAMWDRIRFMTAVGFILYYSMVTGKVEVTDQESQTQVSVTLDAAQEDHHSH